MAAGRSGQAMGRRRATESSRLNVVRKFTLQRRSVAWLAGFGWLVFLAPALVPASAQAQSRIALVIGNSTYRNVPALPNPANDAREIGASLERIGFSVTRVANGSFDDIRRALLDFSRRSRGADMAVLFYAGHGIEVGGENWLIPVDAELKSDTDTEHEAISLRSVVLAVAGARELGLVILDACRNNPFVAKMQRSIRTRAVERGLTRVEPADNVLVAYAAKDGTTAADGAGQHSPFTVALLKHIETPGLEVSFLFRQVRDDVMAATQREQQPFIYGSLSKQAIYLAAAFGDLLFARLASALPGISPKVLEEQVQRYAKSDAPKVMAMHLHSAGTWRGSRRDSDAEALEQVAEGCQVNYGGPCVLAALNETLLLPAAGDNYERRDMPRVRYAGSFDPKRIPAVRQEVRDRSDVIAYREARGPKAVALHPVGRVHVVTEAASQREAEEASLASCRKAAAGRNEGGSCFLYAIGDRVVLPGRHTAPRTSANKAATK
jgi:hypothetical protein